MDGGLVFNAVDSLNWLAHYGCPTDNETANIKYLSKKLYRPLKKHIRIKYSKAIIARAKNNLMFYVPRTSVEKIN